ncbi:MAG TPA: PAS domain S-box protein [Anaerolineales bacterium]|nr:PAS domain S-box protein [Anaerolineales bacterium]
MEEKSIMAKSGKPIPKKRKPNTTAPLLVNVEQELIPSRKVFDAIPLAIVSVDWKGEIQYMNKVARSMLGEPAGPLQLEDWPRRFGLYLDDGSMPYPADKLPPVRALRGEAVGEMEEIILRKEGDAKGIWISMSAEILRDENGNIDGAIALLRDIDYRKQVEFSREKHVRRTEALYRFSHAISEAGNDLNTIMNLTAKFVAEVVGDLSVIALLNADGDKLKVKSYHDTNPTAYSLLRKIYGTDFESEHARTLGGGVIRSGEPLLIPSIPAEQLKAVTLPALKELIDVIGIESVLIVPLVGRSGVVGTISLARHRGNKPFNMEDQSFLTDIAYRAALAIENSRLFESLHAEITERLSTKQALAVSEERFRSIFESVTVGIKVLNLEGRILQTNDAFQSMVGYTEDELVGNYFHKFLHQDDKRPAIKLFDDVKANGTTSFRFEHRAIHKEQSIVWVKTIFTVITKGNEDQSPAFIVGIVENITEQKRIEAEMAELNSRLQSSMELERLRLAQELHDSPMQSLYSAIYRIEELRNTANPELKEALAEVKQHIQGVLQDLRATAKELRPPTLFNFGLENAIRSHANDVVEKHPNINIRLSLAHDRQILPEKVRLALFRIFQQSLANVIRHAKATEVHVRFSFDAEEVQLEITDNGKGFDVPANWIEFVRRGHYGLAGAAERANALGGVLKVQSKPGNSTTIQVIIPWKESLEES